MGSKNLGKPLHFFENFMTFGRFGPAIIWIANLLSYWIPSVNHYILLEGNDNQKKGVQDNKTSVNHYTLLISVSETIGKPLHFPV